MTVKVVDAVSAEVPPVAVTVLDPPVVSRIEVDTAVWHEPAPVVALPPSVVPVVHVKEVVAHIAVAIVTVSPEPNPVTLRVPAIACSGNPKLDPVLEKETVGVMVKGVLTVFVPSDATIVLGPPGRAGTVKELLKLPTAVVVTQPVGLKPLVRLSTPFTPPVAAAKFPPQLLLLAEGNHDAVDVPTVEVTEIGALLANPVPVMVRVVPTVPDVTPVSSVGPPSVEESGDIVDRVTVALAACAAGSKKTIPAIPARNSRPIVPNEASLLFGVICICILFTYFRNFPVPDYHI